MNKQQLQVMLQQATVAVQQGRAAEAQGLLDTLARQLKGHSGVAFLQGVAAHQLGELAAAERAFLEAIGTNPRYAEAFNNLGVVQEAMGKPDEAFHAYAKAVKLKPDYASALFNLGNLHHQRREWDTAADYYRQALASRPASVMALNNLGLVLQELDRPEEAVALLEKAVAHAPQDPELWLNLGQARYRCRRPGAASDALNRAVVLRPEFAEAHNNLGLVQQFVGQFDAAEASYRRAVDLKPDYEEARHNLALLQLSLSQFGEGWRNYLARPSRRRQHHLADRLPLDALAGKRILVERDQGLGDELFFLRFAAGLQARGATVSYRAGDKIIPLLQGVPWLDRVLTAAEDAGETDFRVSVGDLPLLLGVDQPRDLPPPAPLESEPINRDIMAGRLERLGPPPYLGITWRAGVRGVNRLDKAVPLRQLAAALERVEGTLCILQRHPAEGELADFADALGREVGDFSQYNEDLGDMAALLSLLDDYIGVSNTNTHIRAGLGRSARVLIPHPPDWRWMARGATSPWFPDIALYRQSPAGDWKPALQQMSADLTGGSQDVGQSIR